MKKTLLIAALCMPGSLLFAQKNTLLVFGNVGYHNTTHQGTDNKESSFNFNPGVGYQFSDHWTAGIRADINSAKSDNFINTGIGVTPIKYKYSETGVGPFVRYSKSLSDIFSVYGQVEAGFGSGKDKYNGVTATKYTGFRSNLFPAIGINLHKGFALNADFGGLSYNTSKVKGTSGSTNTFDFTFGSTIKIGVSKNFSFKKK